MCGHMIFSHEKYHHDVNVQHFLFFVWFLWFFHVCSWFFMIFSRFFFKKMNQQVQVWCKFAANLHPKLVFFFVFLTCFLHVFSCGLLFFCENHLVLVGNKWITTVCVQVFFNTIYIYIIWLPQHYFPNQKVTCISNMWVENAQWQLPTQAPNSIF